MHVQYYGLFVNTNKYSFMCLTMFGGKLLEMKMIGDVENKQGIERIYSLFCLLREKE